MSARYDRQPVGALQALDPARVAHAGSASKTLAPGLRLGWLVLGYATPPEHAWAQALRALGEVLRSAGAGTPYRRR